MATSRPIRKSEWLTYLTGHHIGGNRAAGGDEHPPDFVLQSDFGLDVLNGNEYRSQVCMRVFGLQPSATDASLAAAITNGTAPGLYVREGDDTSDWETYRQVLARRVEEAMAARRGGAGGGETATAAASPLIRECHWCYNSRRITHSQDDEVRVCSYCFDWPEVAQAREDAAALAAARAVPTATRRDDEIRVGDLVEVVSCNDSHTIQADIGRGGRVSRITLGIVYVDSVNGMRLPIDNRASLADVRKVPSLLLASGDDILRHTSSATAGQRVVNPVPPTAGAFTGIITATGPLRRGEPPASALPTTVSPPPLSPSRFSLLEVDADPSADVKAHEPQALKAPVDLAALQAELRAERETKRALAAAQTSPGRFDLLECDLPAVPIAAAVRAPSPCPVVSPPPPLHRNPVETITDLTTARSPLELTRMLEGLNVELSTMMRQREAN